MRSSKVLILIGVGLLVFGSAGFCAYQLFVKPYSSFSLFHRSSPAPVAAPTPDQGEAAFDTIVTLQNSGKLQEAAQAWKLWLEAHPDSTKEQEALLHLGKANMDILCSPTISEGKESYVVVKGDSLDRIANKKKSNAELIQHVNGLPNINLQIGQELFIPQLQVSLLLDRQKKTLTLRNGDQFFKAYTLLSVPSGSNNKEIVTTTVIDKIVMANNKRVAFGDKKYADSERTILLRSGGNIVSIADPLPSTPVAAGSTNAVTSTVPTLPPGFVLSVSDMKEIFPIINKTTSVSIQ